MSCHIRSPVFDLLPKNDHADAAAAAASTMARCRLCAARFKRSHSLERCPVQKTEKNAERHECLIKQEWGRKKDTATISKKRKKSDDSG